MGHLKYSQRPQWLLVSLFCKAWWGWTGQNWRSGGEGFRRGSSCFSLERVSRNSSGSNSSGVSVNNNKKKIGYHFLFAGYLVCVFASTNVSVWEVGTGVDISRCPFDFFVSRRRQWSSKGSLLRWLSLCLRFDFSMFDKWFSKRLWVWIGRIYLVPFWVSYSSSFSCWTFFSSCWMWDTWPANDHSENNRPRLHLSPDLVTCNGSETLLDLDQSWWQMKKP